MPLPSDEHIVKLSEDLIAQLQAIFGKHPGFRPGKTFSINLQTPSPNAPL